MCVVSSPASSPSHRPLVHLPPGNGRADNGLPESLVQSNRIQFMHANPAANAKQLDTAPLGGSLQLTVFIVGVHSLLSDWHCGLLLRNKNESLKRQKLLLPTCNIMNPTVRENAAFFFSICETSSTPAIRSEISNCPLRGTTRPTIPILYPPSSTLNLSPSPPPKLRPLHRIKTCRHWFNSINFTRRT